MSAHNLFYVKWCSFNDLHFDLMSVLCSAYLMFNYLDIRCFKIMLDVGSKTKSTEQLLFGIYFLGTNN